MTGHITVTLEPAAIAVNAVGDGRFETLRVFEAESYEKLPEPMVTAAVEANDWAERIAGLLGVPVTLFPLAEESGR